MSAKKSGFVNFLQEFSIPLIVGVFAALAFANLNWHGYEGLINFNLLPGVQLFGYDITPHWLIKVADKTYSADDIQRFRDKPKAMQRVRNIALAIYEQGTTILTEDSWWARITTAARR